MDYADKTHHVEGNLFLWFLNFVEMRRLSPLDSPSGCWDRTKSKGLIHYDPLEQVLNYLLNLNRSCMLVGVLHVTYLDCGAIDKQAQKFCVLTYLFVL